MAPRTSMPAPAPARLTPKRGSGRRAARTPTQSSNPRFTTGSGGGGGGGGGVSGLGRARSGRSGGGGGGRNSGNSSVMSAAHGRTAERAPVSRASMGTGGAAP